MPILALGLNVTKSLSPDGPPTIDEPYDISDICDVVLWHSWTCTVAIKANNIVSWGLDPAASKCSGLDIRRLRKIVGHDSPVAYANNDGTVHGLNGQGSPRRWSDVGVDSRGRVFAIAQRIELFASLEAFIADRVLRTWSLPPGRTKRIFVLESKSFVQVDDHLFEVDEELRMVESVEGLRFHVVEGRRNRLGIITDAGDAYIIGTRQKEAELVQVDEDVRLLGLGSDFDMIVTATQVLRRGERPDSIVLTAEAEGEWSKVDIVAEEITQIRCARWSTIFTVNAFG